MIEDNNDNWVMLNKARTGCDLTGMKLVEVLKISKGAYPVDILVFENERTKIRRDIHVYNGHLYYSDYYNGLIKCDRTKLTYSYPF